MGFPTYTLEDYIITREGDIINKKRNRKVKPRPNSKGYLRVNICGKMMFVHRIVAEMYVPNPEKKEQVNHKDGNKLNNNADNLEWVTNQENRDHAVKHGLHVHGEDCPWAKLTARDVACIRRNSFIKSTVLSSIYNVTPHYINDIKRGRRWK